MPYSTRATSGGRGGGRVGSNRESRSTTPPHRQSPGPFGDDEEDEDEDESEEAEEQISMPRTRGPKRKPKTPPPTIHNYHELGLEWGQARADRILARQPHLKTRTPPTTLFEAQALQAQYNLDKTMLCIAEGITRSTLDASL